MVTSLDKNTALVLIDLQKGILAYAGSHPVQDVLNNSAKLLAAFRKANLPIVIVNVNPGNAKWTSARKDAKQGGGTFDEELLKIIPEIKTEPTDIFITKHTWSAFYETAIHDELQKRSVTGIVICGISTSAGVEGTSRAAAERGYNITFALDAMTDTNIEAHANTLKNIFPRLGEVDTTDKIIEVLVG